MFHRMKSEAPKPQAAQPVQQTLPTAPRPIQQPAAAPQAQAAQVSAEERFADFSQYQRPANEQNRTQPKATQAPAQVQPVTVVAPAQQPQAAPAPQSQSQPTQNQLPINQPNQPQEDIQAMNTPNTQNATTPASDEAASRSHETASSTYQRPAGQATPARPGAGYPGAAYPAAMYPAARNTAASATATGERNKLTIGRGIAISGEIDACDHLTVEGTVEAALKGASVLDIAEGGTFYGTVEIDEAVIAGRFEGDITVNGRLLIRSTGTITGSIAYKELEVESGAVIDGRLTPVGAQVEGRKQNSGKGQKQHKGGHNQAAANEGELFNTKAAAE